MRSRRFTSLDCALFPLAWLLAGLAPVVWAIAGLALMAVVLVPLTLAVLLSPSLVPLMVVCPPKHEGRGLWRPLLPYGWLYRSWLRWPWLCWTWLDAVGARKGGGGKNGRLALHITRASQTSGDKGSNTASTFAP
jgi:hypothetical protein